MGDSLPLGDLLPTQTLRVQRGRTLVSSWIFLPHATYLGHRPPTDRLDRLFPLQEFLLCLGQVVLLTIVGAKRLRSFNDVFLLEALSIDPAQARSNRVFELAQSVIVNAWARLKSFEHFSVLNRIWIDSVGVVHCQHNWSLPQQVIDGKGWFY